MSKERVGIYPGTFDPITKGHHHIIRRAGKLVDRLIIGVAANRNKNPLFHHDERAALVEKDLEILRPLTDCTVEVQIFDELLVNFAHKTGAQCIFRGLRAVSDFDYEFQMTGMNLHLAPDIETVFLMAADEWQFVSSSFIKEIHGLGGDIGQFVSSDTVRALDEKRAR
jgi:pantetheine-phosphate adenylyltransferase